MISLKNIKKTLEKNFILDLLLKKIDINFQENIINKDIYL